jgi:hypothetical protein
MANPQKHAAQSVLSFWRASACRQARREAESRAQVEGATGDQCRQLTRLAGQAILDLNADDEQANKWNK